MKTTKVLMWLLLMLIFMSFVPEVSAMGKIYYVSPTGSDYGTGSITSPFKTIKKAISKVLAGDTIYLRSGTYKEKVTISNKGSSLGWITIGAYNNEPVILDGSNSLIKYDGIFFLRDTCKNIRITGLTLRNTKGHGVFVYGSGVTGVRVDHCTINNCQSSGIYGYNANQIEFDNNIVYNVNNGVSYGTTWSPQEAISFSNVQGFKIHHNTLSKYGKEGIDAKSGSSNGEIYSNKIDTTLASPAFQWNYNHIGIYVDAYSNRAHDIRVYNNTITGSGGPGIVLGPEKSTGILENIFIYNNKIDLSYLPGHIAYRGIDSCYDYTWKNIQIYGNTITVRGANHPIRIFPSAPHLYGLTIKDNIISGKTPTAILYQKLTPSQISSEVILSNNKYTRI